MKRLYRFLLNKLPRPLLIRMSYVFRWIAPIFLKGNKVECNVCHKHFRKFLSYGATERSNVLCPNCLSLERHRLMWMYLNENTDFFTAQKTVLHIAPEQCFLKRFKAMKNLKYTTADIESPIADVKMDLHNAPFEDNTFDVIFCNHVLEHVKDDKQCMRELYRIMKPGGFGIFQVPIDYTRATTYEDPSIVTPEDREKHYWQKDHMRLFGSDYHKQLETVGFKVECNEMASKMDPAKADRFRLMKSEILYISRK
ncbi:MAG TPA: class I SAM-dependent methyltransferase [Flavobacteriales bacterium]|nr:class I SAM-dependent methyltransferase [Flavobacteriales bacterium]